MVAPPRGVGWAKKRKKAQQPSQPIETIETHRNPSQPIANHRKPSQAMSARKHRLIGFGLNYYHALGGTKEKELENDEGETVIGHELENPPWEEQNDFLKEIVSTTSSTLFLTEKGQLYQVGMLHGELWKVPTRIEVRLPIPVCEIAAGRHFCLARCGVAVLSWGAGHFGQLGHGPQVSVLDRPEVMSQLLPPETGSSVAQIACGAWHACALTEQGKLFSWGYNRRYQCGTKSPPTFVYPNALDDDQMRFSKVVCGKSHTLALQKNTGKVYSWGASVGCGHSSRKSSIAPPRLVEALQRVVIIDIAAGDSHSLALTGGGRVFGWGSGLEGQLGMGQTSLALVSRPKLVDDLDFVAIVAGHQAKTSQAESVPYPTSSRNIPAQLLSHVPKIVSVHAAGSYSVARSSSGHVYSWGSNDMGALGLPTPSDLVYMEPSSTSASSSNNNNNNNNNNNIPKPTTPMRCAEAKTFDSNHNVLIPKRVDCLHSVSVQTMSGGPNHVWVYGTEREAGQVVITGRTLYELQCLRQEESATVPPSFSYGREDESVDVRSAKTEPQTRRSPPRPKQANHEEARAHSVTRRTTYAADTTNTNIHTVSPPGNGKSRRQRRSLSVGRLIRRLKKDKKGTGNNNNNTNNNTNNNNNNTNNNNNNSSGTRFKRVLNAAFRK